MGTTPLHVAVCQADAQLLELLVAHVKSEKIFNRKNKEKLSPLFFAVHARKLEFVKKLIEKGARVEVTPKKVQKIDEILGRIS